MPTVILPWRGGCPHRERAKRFLCRRYKARWPSWELVSAEWAGGPWCKGRAVAPALRRAASDSVIVADADVWCDGLESAVRAVTCGAAEWAVPHRLVKRLTQDSTDAYLRGAGHNLELDRPAYEGYMGGGVVVAHRDLLLDVPLDPRFEGWGAEDASWGLALQCLAGWAWRGPADLIHLWHPMQERPPGKWGSPANRDLRRRYGHAGLEPALMRQLTQEATDALHHHSLHDRPADVVR